MPPKRSFNGCWTCRYRKVKCDAGRPRCTRCEKSGIECEGYDIKLTFSHITSIREGKVVSLVKRNEVDDKFYRRVIKFSEFPKTMLYETYSKLDHVLESLDNRVSSGDTESVVGPFSVYAVVSRPRSSNVHQILNEEDFTSNSPIAGQNAVEMGAGKSGDSLIHSGLINLAKVSIYGIKGPHYQVNDQNIYHILYPTFYPNIDSDEWLPQGDYMKKLIHASKEGLVASHTYKNLVESFNRMRLAFIKIDHPNNVWDKVVKPFLQCLLFEFFLLNEPEVPLDFEQIEHSPARDAILKTNMKFIINHLILSIASFNNSTTKYSIEKNEDIDLDLRLSIFLRKKALNLLNYHLDGYDDHCNIDDEYDLLLLLGIILQVEIDSYFNIFENFDLLFAIGDFVVKAEKPTNNFKHLHAVTKNLFIIMNTFFLSTQNINLYNYKMNDEDLELYEDLNESYDLIGNKEEEEILASEEPGDTNIRLNKTAQRPSIITNSMSITVSFESSKGNSLISENDLHTDYAFAEDYAKDENFDPDPNQYDVDVNHVHMLYGIPQSLMNLFFRVINLTNHKRVFETEKKYPRNFPKICADVEEILERWTIKWKLTKENQPATEKASFLTPFHRIVFHNIMIFHTCLKIYFKRLIKNEIHQHLIEKVLLDLAKLDELNQDSKSGVTVRPIFWSVLICASDNLNKALNEKFLDLASKFDNITYWRSRQLMYEVWNRRELGEETSWMEMIREWDIVLYLG